MTGTCDPFKNRKTGHFAVCVLFLIKLRCSKKKNMILIRLFTTSIILTEEGSGSGSKERVSDSLVLLLRPVLLRFDGLRWNKNSRKLRAENSLDIYWLKISRRE